MLLLQFTYIVLTVLNARVKTMVNIDIARLGKQCDWGVRQLNELKWRASAPGESHVDKSALNANYFPIVISKCWPNVCRAKEVLIKR